MGEGVGLLHDDKELQALLQKLQNYRRTCCELSHENANNTEIVKAEKELNELDAPIDKSIRNTNFSRIERALLEMTLSKEKSEYDFEEKKKQVDIMRLGISIDCINTILHSCNLVQKLNNDMETLMKKFNDKEVKDEEAWQKEREQLDSLQQHIEKYRHVFVEASKEKH